MSDLTPEEKVELAERCYRSPSEFCRIMLPRWFPTKMPWVHRGLLALRLGRTDFLLDFGPESWENEEAEWTTADLQKILTNFLEEGTDRPLFELHINETGAVVKIADFVQTNLGVIMPRGFSKTTVMNAANLIEIVYHELNFFLYVSESGGHAERQLGSIKTQLGDENGVPNNELLYSVYGAHQPTRNSPLKWTENFIETLKRIRVGAVGRGGQIRGFNKDAERPKAIIYDDLEDSESVKVDAQRKKDSSWFFGTALPTIARGGKQFIIGTLLHQSDAILNKVITSPEFTVVRFGAIDRQGDPLWEWMMNLAQIENKKRAMTLVGELNAFYLEYMSEWKDDKTKMFPSSLLIYTPRGIENFVAMALAQDPAISEDRKADFCSFAVVGMENGGRKHVVDMYAEVGMDPNDQIEKFFELHFQWLCRIPPEFRRHGVEAVAYQRALVGLITAKQYAYSKTYGMNAYFEVFPILHGKKGKVERVQGILKPLLSSHYLTFEKMFPELHTQLVEWPGGKKDCPDSVAMAITLLDPYAVVNLDQPETTVTQLHAPVKQLETELGGSFRHAP